MQRFLPAPAALVMLALAAPALAQSGGADAGLSPTTGDAIAGGGGAGYQPGPERESTTRRRARKRKARPRAQASGPVLVSFAVSRSRLYLHGAPTRLSFRIDGRSPLRDVRIYLIPLGARTPAATIKLGPQPRGRVLRVALGDRQAGALTQGSYTVRVAAKDTRGRRLRRRAGISSTSELAFLHHRFPIAGAFSYGGPGSRFGSARSGHRHQGQDLSAAEGTPVVAPRAATVKAVGYQRAGAGHYVVLDSVDEDRDYVFMHLRTGSITVRGGDRVRTGRVIAAVGTTGSSSGPHLHFEIWVGGGWYTGGHPIDPLPLLRAWPG
jgi:murein DD-endopeptidase MepM/ murein hydrolase activator NlpD